MLDRLDGLVQALQQRLTRLGVLFTSLTVDAASLRVPILGPEPSRHMLLEAPPIVMMFSLYEIVGPDMHARSARITELKDALAAANAAFLQTFTWSFHFFDHDVDFLGIYYGMSDARVADLIRALNSQDTVQLLGSVAEGWPRSARP